MASMVAGTFLKNLACLLISRFTLKPMMSRVARSGLLLHWEHRPDLLRLFLSLLKFGGKQAGNKKRAGTGHADTYIECFD